LITYSARKFVRNDWRPPSGRTCEIESGNTETRRTYVHGNNNGPQGPIPYLLSPKMIGLRISCSARRILCQYRRFSSDRKVGTGR